MIRFFPFCGAVLCTFALASTAPSVQAAEIAEAENPETALSPAILQAIASKAPEGMEYSSAHAWQADFDGDQHPDWLVEAVYSYVGGNGYITDHFVFGNTGDGFRALGRLDLENAIKSVDITDDVLTLTLYKYIGDDPRCCPSGETRLRYGLGARK